MAYPVHFMPQSNIKYSYWNCILITQIKFSWQPFWKRPASPVMPRLWGVGIRTWSDLVGQDDTTWGTRTTLGQNVLLMRLVWNDYNYSLRETHWCSAYRWRTLWVSRIVLSPSHVTIASMTVLWIVPRIIGWRKRSDSQIMFIVNSVHVYC